MSASVGTWSLTLAFLVSASATLSAAVSIKWSRRLLLGSFALYTTAMLALAKAMVDSDFSIAYVASYTERALPTGYKLAALWAGQEGSILLWGWVIALLSAIYVVQTRDETDSKAAGALGTLGVVLGFFALLLVFAADPFARSPQIPADGFGLNPLLQHPSMIAHPPMLFIGYAGFTIPFAVMMGVAMRGRIDDQWVISIRRWLVFSWVFLTVGILLGAQWAYVELGWGGYWAWDPVENASLLPWLTGTALLHSIGAQRNLGMFRRFNVGLVAATFLLCILATYLTRSGVIQSVHAFGESLVGKFFLAFLYLAVRASIAALVMALVMFKPARPLTSLASRPGMFLIANVLLVLITVVVAVGTMFPLISGPFVEEPISVGPSFYNTIVLPMALVLMALMATGPLLRNGPDAASQLLQRLPLPLGIGLASTLVIAFMLSLTSIWALACTMVVVTALAAVVVNLIRLVLQRMAIESESFGEALFRLVDSDHRRFGGQFIHVGMLMLVVGTAGSSLFNIEKTVQLSPGESTQVGQFTLRYDTIREVPGVNYTAIQADVTVADASGRQFVLDPQQRFYNKSEQAHAEVALRSTLVRDFYLTLAGWENNGQLVAFQVIVNPLVAWIWIGGLVMTLGALFCMFGPLLPAPRPQQQTAQQPSRVIHLANPTCSDSLIGSAETTS